MFSTSLLKAMEEKSTFILSSNLFVLRPHNHPTLLLHPLLMAKADEQVVFQNLNYSNYSVLFNFIFQFSTIFTVQVATR